MKNLLNNKLNTAIQVISFLVATFCFSLVFTAAKNCKGEDRINKTVQEVKTATLRARLIDSMKTCQANREIAIIDSLCIVNKKNIAFYQSKAEFYKSNLGNNIIVYRQDTTCAGCCDSIVYNCENTIEAIGAEAEEYSRLNFNLEKKISLKDTIIQSKENSLINANQNISILRKQLEKKNNWFNRNKGIICAGAGFVAGAVTTSFILK